MDHEKLAELYARKTADHVRPYVAEIQDRIEALEARGNGPGRTYSTPESREHKDKFISWLRKPHDHATKAQLEEAESEIEKKAVTVASQPGGGYAVPEEISTDIERRVSLLNPFRSLVTVRQIGTSRYHELVDMNDDSVGWVGEGGARTETDTSTLRDREPTIGTVYAYPKASEESLDDIFFDVASWLTETASDGFAAAEATAIVSGTGTNRPTGYLNTSPVTTLDDASPLRGAGTLMYVPLLGGSPVALSADKVIDLATASLKERYLQGEGVAWVMHRTALSQVRQLKDSSGRYIWVESAVPGVPATLLGYPVHTTDAQETVSANLHPIMFGNWRRGYVLVDRVGLRILVNPYSVPGQVSFYVRRRVGGIIRNNDALRAGKWSAS